MENWFKENYDGCCELATNLLEGYFDEYLYDDHYEITDIFKYITKDKWSRFQVFKERKTGLYSVFFGFDGEECDEWGGYDLSESLPLWINFIEECKKEVETVDNKDNL